MGKPLKKPDKYTPAPPDFCITEAKYRQLQNDLEKTLSSRPLFIVEMRKYASDGDFSENAAYQTAKGQLRSLNRRILKIQNILNNAEIIPENTNTKTVALGHFVTLKIDSSIRTCRILGSLETAPLKNIISDNSPIGSAVMGRAVGDIVEIKLNHTTVYCQILSISNSDPADLKSI